MSYNGYRTASGSAPPPPGLPNYRVNGPMAGLQHEYNQIKEGEERRHQFMEDLMAQVTSLAEERDDAKRRLERMDVACGHYQISASKAQDELDGLRKTINCDRFVLVLIDGDDALFNDSYVSDGAAGGERAATDLHNAILGYLRPREDFEHDFKIQIRIYLNLAGMAGICSEAKIIINPGMFNRFVQAFNKTNELCEIIDAGHLKEAADSKIKASFNLFRRNLHCKHIMLAGSGDNSYAGFLHHNLPHASDDTRVTLIKGREFAKDLKPFAEKLDTISFPNVFRESAIQIWRSPPPAHVAIPTTTASAWSPAPATVTPSKKVNEVTSGHADLAIRPSNHVKPPSQAKQCPVTAPRPKIWVNANDERLDVPIKDYDKDVVTTLKKRKLCNQHHLRGDCSGVFCNHSHQGQLSEREKKALQVIARTRPCNTGLSCQDPLCFDGHRCMSGANCTKPDCWFSNDMHYVSFDGAKEITPTEYFVVTCWSSVTGQPESAW